MRLAWIAVARIVTGSGGGAGLSQDQRVTLSVRSERAVLVGVRTADANPDLGGADHGAAALDELASLTQTAGAVVVQRVTQVCQSIHPGTYIGRGKAEEIASIVRACAADVVIFDNDMSPHQLRDLEEIIQCKILDRSELILDIFATRARTHEAQLQVGLAQLEYTYPRLRHMWSHLERIGTGAGAGVGARGPGEMQLEIDRRLVRRRIADFKKQIAGVQRRKASEVRMRKQRHFTVSLVGYTNAGKSTLFNTLTGAESFVEDKLFATLDTKTRAWRLAAAHTALLSDTVGFVRDLPHHLVASFKATLEEATHADLLLIVVDLADSAALRQLRTVRRVLLEIGCADQAALLVLNKIDAVRSPDDLAFWRATFPTALPLSARNGAGTAALVNQVLAHLLGEMRMVQISVPLDDAKGITFLEKFAVVQRRDYDSHPGRVALELRISSRILEQLYQQVRDPVMLQQCPLKGAAAPSAPPALPVRVLLPETGGATWP